MASINSAVKNYDSTGQLAEAMASQRFMNKDVNPCMKWSGYDSMGREVERSTQKHTKAGCDSPLLRINVENEISRSQYADYIPPSRNGKFVANVGNSAEMGTNTGIKGRTAEDGSRRRDYIQKKSGRWGGDVSAAIRNNITTDTVIESANDDTIESYQNKAWNGEKDRYESYKESPGLYNGKVNRYENFLSPSQSKVLESFK
jgi:hypothetical protein